MNEVTKIHLGRQAFSISIEAQRQLRGYIDEIKKEVDDKDVVDEVELRMAELLAERGVTGEKVILPADVEFLKKQLGNPQEFKEDDTEPDSTGRPSEGKRLFRDTDNAMVAGVAAGLSKYLGIDVLFIRILFILSVFIWGWGLLAYIVLWLLVPEAKSSSDRLRMIGKAVTVESLKEVVERADVKGAANRANRTIAGPINAIFSFILKLAGLAFVCFGLAALLGLITGETYFLIHHNDWLKDNVFPVGFQEHLLLYIAVAVASLIAVFIILFGMAIFRRKWPLRTWITGMLIGLILIGTAIGGVLAADAFPGVRDRYNANVHMVIRNTKPFTSVNVLGSGAMVVLGNSDKYFVSLKYYGDANLSNIKTDVINGVLTIDMQQFDEHRHCSTICIPDTNRTVVTVNSPNQPAFEWPAGEIKPFPVGPAYFH